MSPGNFLKISILLIGLQSYLLNTASKVLARDYDIGFSSGTAFLYGDNATSDAGASFGLTNEMRINNEISVGMESIYQRLRGKSLIDDQSSIFYGPHQYDTKFFTMELFTRFKIPGRFIQPYISLGAGGALWVPGENEDTGNLPMKRKISWATTPLASLGTGIMLHFGNNWEFDIGAKSLFFFSDELDNIDGHYVTGKPSRNEYSLQMGITMVYRLGGKAGSKKGIIPEIPYKPILPIPSQIIPEATIPKTDNTNKIIKQEPVFETIAPESDSTTKVSTKAIIPNEIRTETPDAASKSILSKPIEKKEPRASIPTPIKPKKVVILSYLVHVTSFPTKDEADDLIGKLGKAGYKTQVKIVDRREIGKWFRVYVGPHSTRADAERIADRLKKAGLSDYSAVIEESK